MLVAKVRKENEWQRGQVEEFTVEFEKINELEHFLAYNRAYIRSYFLSGKDSGGRVRLTDNDLKTLRLALEVWTQQESEGATTPQDELDEAEKLWQKLTRESHRRKEKESN